LVTAYTVSRLVAPLAVWVRLRVIRAASLACGKPIPVLIETTCRFRLSRRAWPLPSIRSATGTCPQGSAASWACRVGWPAFDDEHVPAAVSVQVTGVGLLSMKCVGGDHHASQVDPVQHCPEGGDVVALGLGQDLPCRDAGAVVDDGEQVHPGPVRAAGTAAGLAVDRHRPKRRRDRGWRGKRGQPGVQDRVQHVGVHPQ